MFSSRRESKFHPVLNRTVVQPLEECDKAGVTTYYWYYKTLQISPNIETNTGTNWRLTLCLLAAWVLVTLCLLKGTKSFGKVRINILSFIFLYIH